jgi:hypothetical protein
VHSAVAMGGEAAAAGTAALTRLAFHGRQLTQLAPAIPAQRESLNYCGCRTERPRR